MSYSISTAPFGGPNTGFGVVASQGVPLVGNSPFGNVWFVDGNLGADGNDGNYRGAPLKTMAEAFTRISSGDVIYFRGNITEQISTPAGVFDVTIIGGANQPRHADAHTGNNGYSSATWKFPSSGGSASTPLLIVQQQGWKLLNILFDGPASAAAVQIFRDGGAGDSERDGSHVQIGGCKFVAAQNHIEFKGGLSQVVIENNLFFGATAASIKETVGAGIGTNNYFRILNNEFHNNVSHFVVGTNYASIRGNTFGAFTASTGFGLDLNGGSNNIVWGNYMSGDYDGDYRAGTSDEWAGNYSMDVSSGEVGAEGLTIAVPVA